MYIHNNIYVYVELKVHDVNVIPARHTVLAGVFLAFILFIKQNQFITITFEPRQHDFKINGLTIKQNITTFIRRARKIVHG